MIGGWLALALAVTSPPLQDYLPCTPGLAITYRWTGNDGQTDTRIDTVEGARGRLCFVRRRQGHDRDTFVREMLQDRILDAGWRDAMTAFRAPLLRGPLVDGHQWRFNRVEYRLKVLSNVATSVGRFRDAVQVHANSVVPGAYQSVRTYVPQIGLIEERRPHGIWKAVKVAQPPRKSGQ